MTFGKYGSLGAGDVIGMDFDDFSGVFFVTPIGSNELRVFFDREPRRWSPLSEQDATERNNYVVTLTAGVGGSPIVETAFNATARPTFDPAFPDAWSVDLKLDRRVLAVSTYEVVISNVLSIGGSVLCVAPNDRRSCPGIASARDLRDTRPPAASRGIDFAYDVFGGTLIVDEKHDVSVQVGRECAKKRILRRMMTRPGGFFHLARYGVGLVVKGLSNTAELNRIKAEVTAQVLEEDDVLDVSVSVSLPAHGVLAVSANASTIYGDVSASFEASAGGFLVAS